MAWFYFMYTKELDKMLAPRTHLSLSSIFSKIIDERRNNFQKRLEKFNQSSSTTLFLDWCSINNVEAKTLGELIKINPKLLKLSMVGCRLENQAIQYISEALSLNDRLSFLKLSSTNMDDSGAAIIGTALKNHTKLKYLDLGYNNITPFGFSSLCGSLLFNTSLEYLVLPQSLDLFENYLSKEGVKQITLALAVNYNLVELNLGGVNNDLISKYLDRNKAIARCLSPLNAEKLIHNPKTFEIILIELEKLIPNLNSLSKGKYPAEHYRLLKALTTSNNAQQWHCLLPSFTNPILQHHANKFLGQLLLSDFNLVLNKHKMEKEGFLLALYCFKDQIDNPGLRSLAFKAFDQFLSGAENNQKNSPISESKIAILSQNEILKLLTQALTIYKLKKNANSQEIFLLEVLIASNLCYAFTLSTACLSPAFINVLHSHYPNAKSLTSIEHCLLTAANKETCFLLDVSREPFEPITEDQVANYAFNLVKDKTEPLNVIVKKLKEDIEKVLVNTQITEEVGPLSINEPGHCPMALFLTMAMNQNEKTLFNNSNQNFFRPYPNFVKPQYSANQIINEPNTTENESNELYKGNTEPK